MDDTNNITDIKETTDALDTAQELTDTAPELTDTAPESTDTAPESTDTAQESTDTAEIIDPVPEVAEAPEEGFYDVTLSDEEYDKEFEEPKKGLGSNGLIITAFAVLAGVAVILIVVFFIRNHNEQSTSIESTYSGTEKSGIITPNNDGTDPQPVEGTSSEAAAPDEDAADVKEPIDYTDYGVKVTIGDYKNLSLNVAEVSVTQEELDALDKDFIESIGKVELRDITDRPAQLGDTVIVDYDGIVDGEHHDSTTGTDFELELGSGRTINGFESGMVGLKIGDTKVLNLTFPDSYGDADFAGKPVDFTITMKKIRQRYYPEITDEMVSENSDYKTAAEFHEAKKNALLEQKTSNAKNEAFRAEIEKLANDSVFSSEIEKEIDDRVEYYRNFYYNYFTQNFGVDPLTYASISQEEYDGYLRQIAEPEVKYPYIYRAIATAEGYSPSEQEKTDKFNEIFFDVYGYESEEALYKTFTPRMCEVTVEQELERNFGYNWLTEKLGMND